MRGKNKCKILKEIRQKIADENDIPYVTRECSYQGDCKGTCPKCEAELRYLEQELEKRKNLGKAVAVAAVAASLTFTAGCVPSGSGAEIADDPATTTPTAEVDVLDGEVPTELQGDVYVDPTATPGEPDEPYELEGDVAYIPSEIESTMGMVPIEDPQPTEGLPIETIPVVPESTDADAN